MKGTPLTVIFRPELLPVKRRGAATYNGIPLKPGANQKTANDVAKLRSHPLVTALEKSRAIEVIEPSEETDVDAQDLPRSLDSYTVADAQTLIANITDLTVLEMWQKAESKRNPNRKGIMSALSERVEEINKGTGL